MPECRAWEHSKHTLSACSDVEKTKATKLHVGWRWMWISGARMLSYRANQAISSSSAWFRADEISTSDFQLSIIKEEQFIQFINERSFLVWTGHLREMYTEFCFFELIFSWSDVFITSLPIIPPLAFILISSSTAPTLQISHPSGLFFFPCFLM